MGWNKLVVEIYKSGWYMPYVELGTALSIDQK